MPLWITGGMSASVRYLHYLKVNKKSRNRNETKKQEKMIESTRSERGRFGSFDTERSHTTTGMIQCSPLLPSRPSSPPATITAPSYPPTETRPPSTGTRISIQFRGIVAFTSHQLSPCAVIDATQPNHSIPQHSARTNFPAPRLPGQKTNEHHNEQEPSSN